MQHKPDNAKPGGWKSWFWMVLCCLPMIAIIVLAMLGFFGSR